MRRRTVLCGHVFVLCLTCVTGTPAGRDASLAVDTGDVDGTSLRGLSRRSTSALKNVSLALLGESPPVTPMSTFEDVDNVGHCPKHTRTTSWSLANFDYSEMEIEIVEVEKLPDYELKKWYHFWDTRVWKPHPYVRLVMEVDGKQTHIQTPNLKSVRPDDGVKWNFMCRTSISWEASDIMIHGEVRSKDLHDDQPAIAMGVFAGHMSLTSDGQEKVFDIILDDAVGDGGRQKMEPNMFRVKIRAVSVRGPWYVVPIAAGCVAILVVVVFFLLAGKRAARESEAVDASRMEMTECRDVNPFMVVTKPMPMKNPTWTTNLHPSTGEHADSRAVRFNISA